ncbi:MAG: hypothetical protein DRH57_02020 [Candidatus Cloacimonadota bacterium]|nr:MAG: hypothetical protein DRH57_02020 [Candidatus Cloacimonadota bacterium]
MRNMSVKNVVNNNVEAYFTDQSIKKDCGIFFTPEWIIDFMTGLINYDKYTDKAETIILEPACGLIQFLSGIKRSNPKFFNKSKKYGIEINKEIVDALKNNGLVSEVEI